MIETLDEFESRLHDLDVDDVRFELAADEIVCDLAPSIKDKVYRIVFKYFEKHPDADCGAPGTLVHQIEYYYSNYLEALVESVHRQPSFNGVLMVNRILNSQIDDTVRYRLMAALQSVLESDKPVSAHVLKMVNGFLKRHS